GAFAPSQSIENISHRRIEQSPTKRSDVQRGMVETFAAGTYQHPQAVFQETACVIAEIQVTPRQTAKRPRGRETSPPCFPSGEIEPAARVSGAFELQNKQQSIYQRQRLPPQIRGGR